MYSSCRPANLLQALKLSICVNHLFLPLIFFSALHTTVNHDRNHHHNQNDDPSLRFTEPRAIDFKLGRTDVFDFIRYQARIEFFLLFSPSCTQFHAHNEMALVTDTCSPISVNFEFFLNLNLWYEPTVSKIMSKNVCMYGCYVMLLE